MRFVMEMVVKDRSFEENNCEVRGKKENVIVGGGLWKFIYLLIKSLFQPPRGRRWGLEVPTA